MLSNWEKNVTRSRYLSPWIRNSYAKCIDSKYRVFRKYNAGLVSFDYHRYKNIVTTLLRRAKVNYIKEVYYDSIDNPLRLSDC